MVRLSICDHNKHVCFIAAVTTDRTEESRVGHLKSNVRARSSAGVTDLVDDSVHRGWILRLQVTEFHSQVRVRLVRDNPNTSSLGRDLEPVDQRANKLFGLVEVFGTNRP